MKYCLGCAQVFTEGGMSEREYNDEDISRARLYAESGRFVDSLLRPSVGRIVARLEEWHNAGNQFWVERAGLLARIRELEEQIDRDATEIQTLRDEVDAAT